MWYYTMSYHHYHYYMFYYYHHCHYYHYHPLVAILFSGDFSGNDGNIGIGQVWTL